MKIFTLFTTLVLFYISSLAQETKILSDSSYILGKLKRSTFLFDQPNDLSLNHNKFIEEGEWISIYGYFRFESMLTTDEFLGIYHESDSGYLKYADIIMLDSDFGYLKNRNMQGMDMRKHYAKIANQFLINQKLNSLYELMKSYEKKGIVITKKEYAYAEYGSQFGLSLSFYNGFKKSIKYINISIRAYNRVGDLTNDDLGRSIAKVKIIGPIESKSEGSANFDELFWDENDIIDCLKVTYLKVTFMDNTYKEFTDINNHLGESVSNKCP